MLELRRRYGSSVPSGGSGRLPAGYKEVEYIQGDGNAWIDTGFIATGGMTCEYQGAWIEGEGKSGYIIGSHDTTSPYNRNSLWYHKDEKVWQFAYGDAIKLSSVSIDAFQKNTYTFSTLVEDAYAKINNDVVYSTYGFNLQPKNSVKIFRIGDFADNILGIIKATLYYAKIWDSNNILIREFIPCINPSGEVGMYDLVGKQFYGNAGTGQFLAGAVVGNPTLPKEYQEVEYLESVYTCYIDTGILLKKDFEFEIKYQVLDVLNNNYAALFGVKDTAANSMTLVYHNQQKSYVYLYATTEYNLGYEDLNKVSILRSNSKEFELNGSIQPISEGGVNFTKSLYLFNFNQSQFAGKYTGTNSRIYYVKIRNEQESYYLIPCRRLADNEKGMYDIVNDVFYTNAGTGEFLVGADVGDETNNFEPKLIENLIVETDIVLSHNYEYEIKLSFGDHWSNGNGSGLIFGLNSSYYRLFQINGMLYYDINGQNNRAQYTLPDALKTDYFVCKLNNCNIYINDVLVATGTKYNGSISQEGKYLKLFMNTSDPQYAMYSFKGYYDYLKIYNESGELIHELRMRDTTEVWDVVTNKVYPCISLLA